MDFTCAECGTKTATTYVVTILNHDNSDETRTEVCRECDDELRLETPRPLTMGAVKAGDTVVWCGTSYVAESVQLCGGAVAIVWADTNEGRPYYYELDQPVSSIGSIKIV